MNTFPPVLYRGSVKNVRGEVYAPNLLFEFSDRYSVFDWGEMPDQLQDKGKTLAVMGKGFFYYLGLSENWKNLFESKTLQEHFSPEYLKLLQNSKLYKRYCNQGLDHHALLSSESWNNPYLKVKNISILRPHERNGHYNYEDYKFKPINTLVPLEIIFRLGLSKGNSLSKRLGDDQSKWEEFGFQAVPEVGTLLKIPVIDFSTKLERGDRYLDYKEAKEIAGLSNEEWIELNQMTHLIALNLFDLHHSLGLELWDGKIEVAFVPEEQGRSFMLVDSIGIDELRLLYNGKSFSKEFLRENYKGSSWYENLQAAKRDAANSGVDFKEICIEKYESTPEPLDPYVKERAEAVYKSYANAITGKILGQTFFPEEYNLEEYSKRYL